MADRLLGLETEYAVNGTGPDGETLDRQEIVERLQAAAFETLMHVADVGSGGVFLQNGSRFYVDAGLHPELSTPECADPREVVRYALAGDRILAGLAQHVQASFPEPRTRNPGSREPGTLSPQTRIDLFRCNVDYGGTGTTWGCHESYLHRLDPMALADPLIPHLVTRIIYTGAGGFNPVSPGLEFCLSPRVHHLMRPISGDSTSYRGIFHAKDEPLCGDGYHRLHVLCGDRCCSQLAAWLKTGATALIVALAEAGLSPGAGVQLWSPISAMQVVARDPACRATLTLAGGRQARAVDIQRRYLELAVSHLGDSFMPDWAAEVCDAWRATLDRIETDPASLATRLDWAIKHALFAQHAGRRGFAWESLPRWTEALATVEKADQESDALAPLSLEELLDSTGPARRHVRALGRPLRARGLDARDLPRFLDLRRELFELDMRFGQLGDQGIFSALDSAAVLAHRVAGVDRVEQAMTEPPLIGRAAIRGGVIRRANNAGRYVCTWSQVWDLQSQRVLDLSHPFETTEQWRDMRGNDPFEARLMGGFPIERLGFLGRGRRPRETQRRRTGDPVPGS